MFLKRWTNCTIEPCYYCLQSKWVQIVHDINVSELENNNNSNKIQVKTWWSKGWSHLCKKMKAIHTHNYFHVISLHRLLGKKSSKTPIWPPLWCKWGDLWPWTWHILNITKNPIIFQNGHRQVVKCRFSWQTTTLTQFFLLTPVFVHRPLERNPVSMFCLNFTKQKINK